MGYKLVRIVANLWIGHNMKKLFHSSILVIAFFNMFFCTAGLRDNFKIWRVKRKINSISTEICRSSQVHMVDVNCCICLEDVVQDSVTLQPCGHSSFHSKCIQDWLEQSQGVQSCPLCRMDIAGVIEGNQSLETRLRVLESLEYRLIALQNKKRIEEENKERIKGIKETIKGLKEERRRLNLRPSYRRTFQYNMELLALNLVISDLQGDLT